jgi:hypothetical protein
MTIKRALTLAFALTLLGTPVLAQDAHGHDSATAAPQIGPAMMNDIRFTMGTMMNDPVIVKRMNQLMATNPQFKQHFEQMRGMMATQGWMMNGHGGMMNGANGRHSSMMSQPATPMP